MDKYLITKKEIAEHEGIRKTHFLNRNAKRINKSLGDLTRRTGFGFHLIEIEPECESKELHMHHHEDEYVSILDGETEATIGDSVFRVRQGDFLGYRAGGEAHKLKNIGASVLRCIVVGQRLDQDSGDYPVKKAGLSQ